jgi:rhodanese-related sulfurtransferase
MRSKGISIRGEIVFIALLAILVGLGAKVARKNGIPVWGSPPIVKLLDVPEANAEPGMVHPDSFFVPSEIAYGISLARTASLYLQREKLGVYFLDARSTELYEEGHIAGALNLPYEHLQDYCDDFVPSLDKEKLIIIYCDNKDCTLSLELAEALLAVEFRRIAVFEGGWDEWVESGYPVATGVESGD